MVLFATVGLTTPKWPPDGLFKDGETVGLTAPKWPPDALFKDEESVGLATPERPTDADRETLMGGVRTGGGVCVLKVSVINPAFIQFPTLSRL
jgi:hypothetical protein